MDYIVETFIGTDERCFCVEMMRRLDIQRRNEQFCDVILEVGSGDNQARLKAHRVVLCAASPFFFNALNSDMKEKKEGVIRLEGTSKAVMEEVLEYLYTGHVDIDEDNALNLLAASDYFLIPSLTTLCVRVILQALSLSSCIAAYYTAMKYRCEELQKGAKDFILANFVAVAETEDFLNLSSKQVEEWISSDEIIVEGEEDVFQVVVRWMERNECQKDNFFELFRHIRCIYLPRVYLSNVVLHDPMVKNNTDCSNRALDSMKMVFCGGEECYFAQSPRNCLKTHENAIVACGKKSTLCYIPSEDKWYKLSSMLSTGNFFSHAISVCQGKLFFIGDNSDGCAAERYDPAINSWAPLESFKQKIKFCAVVTFQGLLYVIGGVKQEENKHLSTVQRYNPDKNLWQVVPSLSTPRSHVCAVATGNYLYAVGGKSDVGFVNIVERFDPKENAWYLVAPTLEKRVIPCGGAVNEKLFVFGRFSRENYSDSNFCEMYDPVTDMWSTIITNTCTVTPRWSASAVSFKGKIFVCGNFGGDDSLQIYDIAVSEWKFCSKFPQSVERFKISCLRIPREVLDKCEVLS